MAATTAQLIALSNDGAFRTRVMGLAIQIAGTIYSEAASIPNHVIRANFAKLVMNGGGQHIPSIIAFRGNITGTNITYNFSNGHIETDATDGAISSQIDTDWNMLAGV